VAKAIATISGVALAPGVSKNGRLYTRETIARAVTRAQGRIADGTQPLTILTHHEAGDDSSRIVGRITGMSVAEDGSARFTADLADTPHARTIASLVDNTSGQPFLSGMSIRGAWVGKVRRVRGPAGDPVETADDLEFSGLDPTHKPGVAAAGVDTFAWAKDGTDETTERVLITESVQEARVTITEETAELAAEAAGAKTPAPPGTVYADPGYLKDKKKRYPLSSEKRIRAAWAYINQKDNAAQYTAAQLGRIKGKIKAAMKRIGAKIADENWVYWPAEYVAESDVAEYSADEAATAGSFSVTASNGPVTVCLSSYCIDPADLELILQAAAEAAGGALKALDPDMDADIDVPGADAEDTDRDMGSDQADNGDGVEDLVRRLMSAVRGESAEDPETLLAEARDMRAGATQVTPASPAPSPAAADREGTEDPAVSETTTQEAVGAAPAAAYSQADIDAAVQRALSTAGAAKKAKKAAKKAKAAEAAAAPAMTETADERIARLVEERLAAARPAEVTETEDQRVARIVEERLVAERQAITAAGGGPYRKGLVTEHSAARAAEEGVPADFPMKDGEMVPMEKWSAVQRRAVGDVLQRTYLGSRAEIL
jgi:Family of unknown function (DUF6582)